MNVYSPTWFDVFLSSIDPAQTEREISFLTRVLPLPRYQRVLDVCCGTGRHAIGLAQRGYQVLGIDSDERAIERARAAGEVRAAFARWDMREIGRIDQAFDAITLLWQSFGQFDERTNHDVLRQIADKLASGGRFVIDLYHRDFFATRLATRQHERGGRKIVEHKRMTGNRLTVRLDYDDGTHDAFQWQVFTPEELTALARTVEMNPILACSDFDERSPPTSDRPRVQYVFEKR